MSVPTTVLAQAPTLPVDVVGTGEVIAFWILGPLALAAALAMVLTRSAVHSALWLVLVMLCLGALYMVQQAPFLGFVQIIVYTGAIMMLFLFVLMLVGRDRSDAMVEVIPGQRVAGLLAGVGFAALLVGAVGRSLTDVVPVGLLAQNTTGGGNTVNIGRSLFSDYLFPFELTSALLITAAVGAMVLAFTNRERAKRSSQRARVEARLRGKRVSPLPGPGVFATANSVATPALLPDGTVASESLSDIIESVTRESLDADVLSVSGAAQQADIYAVRGPEAAADESGLPVARPAGEDGSRG
ncbi:MAG: NADH-quinone oxidoreductase subunit J [Actinomycetota bacterium]|nr:NADH-quinone oxidoreductase subunit J [Actinomycetota bacterium]